jgi:diguanylate cyclase (GGDEF)-like protein
MSASCDHDRLASPGALELAVRVGGVLWLSGAAMLLLILALPGRELPDQWLIVLLAAFGVVLGAAMLLVVRAGRASVSLAHVAPVLGLAMTAALAPLTGGTDSPAREYVWFAVVYASLFFPLRQAVGYWLACGVVHALPLFYEGGATEANLLRELAIVVPMYVLVGSIVIAGRELFGGASQRAAELEAEQRAMAEEQSSLRRVATAVAAGSPPTGTFALVSSEAGRLLRADAAAIGRFQGDDSSIALGRWAREAADRTEPGGSRALHPGDLLYRLRHEGATVREDAGPGRHRSRLAAPVHVGASLWGALVVAARDSGAFGADAERRLQDYADLIATAVANAEDRARLETQAATDPLSGLPNHRAFRERLEHEAARARRHRRPLTIALFDVDAFGELNDRVGLEAADATLVEIGELLRGAVREEDVVARMGGDEFGVILVESDRHDALVMADRARRIVAQAPLRHHLRATVSVGLCDLDSAATTDELLCRAEASLSWAKQHGRDLCWVYDRTVVREVAGSVRDSSVDRTHALVGLRALARTIDAKDAATCEHSERVAAMAARLAAARGWSPDRVALLREAAMLHDVGKIGVPDAILLKEDRLTQEEFSTVREHPVLGARIASDVLDDEQVTWIACHHERPDGGGYPSGLGGAELSEGAALLALADAWDAMVSRRSYSPAMRVAEALHEARVCAGSQFDRAAVDALETVAVSRELMVTAARLHQPTAA